VPWVLAPRDTGPPRVQRLRALTRQRLELRFNEPVRLDTLVPDAWRLRDSLADASIDVTALYQPPSDPGVVRLTTAPMRPQRHRLQIPGGVVRDTLGRPLADTTVGVDGVEQPDTLQTRFVGFRPPREAPDSTGADPLVPVDTLAVRFNQPLDSTQVRRVLAVADTTGAARRFTTRTSDGVTYRLHLDPPLEAGQFADVQVRQQPLTGRDTVRTRRVRRVTRRALGDLEGTTDVPEGLRSDSAATRVVVEALAVESTIPTPPRRLTTAPGSTFVVRSLPEGTFRFRAFLDRNGNGRWDAGTLRPYRPPEPITWSDAPTESRPRWTNVLGSPLRFPAVDRAAPSDTVAAPDTTATPGG